MSWSTGSSLMSEIINELKEVIPDDKIRQEVYEKLIGCFENYDCDTLYECQGEDDSFDKAYTELYPEEDDEIYEDEEELEI